MFLGAVLIVKVGRTTHVVQCKAVLVAYLCCVGCITDLVSSLLFLLSVLHVIEDVIYRSPFSVELRVELLMFLGAELNG